ncbi:hypothetical protein ASPZODRAFT_137350 [Penicilliopsis zonata CBS 506.65]|uniref:Alpha N-terminal protein methyltransferase 1 n=1 Tax=Penicilliopsis zonata CBS 506.65 TaxID=1073090 RepID=A0A1L9S598_9EURO|nr:hypothetical protein ASPZODRAFT_137350 [Penicilliopsis zonata CBS 506.65]OJJ42331.1 hypothetical protein ASPZODRAFT_137350 [Penicilliopsis zonata CBS 506.65]
MAANEGVDAQINTAASIEYWNNVPATANGMLAMLGAYPWYTRIDLRGSRSFLARVRRLIPGCTTEGRLARAVDCGAGVGRVTEGFLGLVSEAVDAVEPVAKFTQVLQASALKREQKIIQDVYTMGLEDWQPDKAYDLVWIQFCLGHLKDQQLCELLQRCRAALTATGVIVVKENLSTHPQGQDMYDELDSSVTRTDDKFRALFDQAGLRLIASELQLGFPKTFKLLPVRFYALRKIN